MNVSYDTFHEVPLDIDNIYDVKKILKNHFRLSIN